MDFGLTGTSRVKRFVFSVFSMPFMWIVSNGKIVQIVYTDNADYIKLQV